jgi:hypothetical protein
MALRSFKLNVGFHRHKVGGQRAFANDSGCHKSENADLKLESRARLRQTCRNDRKNPRQTGF